jgi:hypothetical protein
MNDVDDGINERLRRSNRLGSDAAGSDQDLGERAGG